jgi:hypothetical protein
VLCVSVSTNANVKAQLPSLSCLIDCDTEFVLCSSHSLSPQAGGTRNGNNQRNVSHTCLACTIGIIQSPPKQAAPAPSA